MSPHRRRRRRPDAQAHARSLASAAVDYYRFYITIGLLHRSPNPLTTQHSDFVVSLSLSPTGPLQKMFLPGWITDLQYIATVVPSDCDFHNSISTSHCLVAVGGWLQTG